MRMPWLAAAGTVLKPFEVPVRLDNASVFATHASPPGDYGHSPAGMRPAPLSLTCLRFDDDGKVGGDRCQGLDERVAALEGRMEGQVQVIDDLRIAVADLGRRMDRGFDDVRRQVDQRVSHVDQQLAQVDRQIDQLDGRFPGIDQRFANLDGRLDNRFGSFEPRFDGIGRRFDAFEVNMNQRFDMVDRRFIHLEEKMTKQFLWLAGIQVTTVLAFMAALVTILASRSL